MRREYLYFREKLCVQPGDDPIWRASSHHRVSFPAPRLAIRKNCRWDENTEQHDEAGSVAVTYSVSTYSLYMKMTVCPSRRRRLGAGYIISNQHSQPAGELSS